MAEADKPLKFGEIPEGKPIVKPELPEKLAQILAQPFLIKWCLMEVTLDNHSKTKLNLLDGDNKMFLTSSKSGSHHMRGSVAHMTGFHVWEVQIKKLGVSTKNCFVDVGVALADFPITNWLNYKKYQKIPSRWGWDLDRYSLLNGDKFRLYPSWFRGPYLSVSVVVALDMDQGTLSFFSEGQYNGIAFSGLKNKTLIPSIVFSGKQYNVLVKHIGSEYTAPPRLTKLCCQTLIKSYKIDSIRWYFEDVQLPIDILESLHLD